MSRLTLFSVRNRALIALATVFGIVAGLWSMSALPRELFPSLQFPVIAVTTSVPGAGAEVVEEQVTEPMEVAVQGLDGVERVESTSTEGFSAVTVELDYGTDLGAAQTELQRTVIGLPGLPEDADPQVFTGSIDDFPILQLSATGGSSSGDLVDRLETSVVPEIEDLDGVRDVQLTGVADQIVRIDLDEQAAAEAGVSAASVAQLLQVNGVVVPGGAVRAGDSELAVQTGSRIGSTDEVADLPLSAAAPAAPSAPTGEPPGAGLTLGDVADVELTQEEPTAYTRTNGEPSVGLAVTKTPEGNAVEISHALEEVRPELEAGLDGGALTVVFDQAPFIEQSIDDLTHEGLLGLGFAILVVLVFLLSVRLTLVTALSIPLSLLVAMLGLQVAGYTLNILTLGALTIAIGRVVDDSIVVIENIKRHLGLGEERRQAIVAAVQEVAGAITSATVATVAVFLPMAFVGGQVGELFRPFAFTIAIAMGGSLLVALTIIPVLGYWFLGASGGRTRARGDEPDRLQRAYLPVLRTSLAHPVVTVLGAVALLAATGWAATALKTQFIGSTGEDTLTASLELPAGTRLEQTDAESARIEDWLQEQQDVESYQVTVGSTGGIEAVFLGGGSNTATYSITLDPEVDQEAFADRLREAGAPETEGELTVTPGMPQPGASEVVVLVTAPDDTGLAEAAAAAEEAVRASSVTDVSNNLSDTVLALEVDVNREAAAVAGLTEAQVGQAVSAAIGGRQVGQVEVDGARTPVVVRQGEPVTDVAALEGLVVGAGADGPVTLADVAELEQVEQPASVTRTDGRRSATITATPQGSDLGALTADIEERLADLDLPEGVRAEIGGVSAEQQDAFASLGLALLAAVAIVYLVMVATFNSLVQPLILMVSVPFAATGSLAMLLLTDTPLDVSALIGMLMLVGIVVTNAIVLIDLVNQYRARGADIGEAVIEGSRHRLRPIVMTALATIGALTPMALAVTGGGAFISQPLALVVIGGLVTSTALTLLLVPVLYQSVERFTARLGGRATRRRRRGRHLDGETSSAAGTPQPGVPAPTA